MHKLFFSSLLMFVSSLLLADPEFSCHSKSEYNIGYVVYSDNGNVYICNNSFSGIKNCHNNKYQKLAIKTDPSNCNFYVYSFNTIAMKIDVCKNEAQLFVGPNIVTNKLEPSLNAFSNLDCVKDFELYHYTLPSSHPIYVNSTTNPNDNNDFLLNTNTTDIHKRTFVPTYNPLTIIGDQWIKDPRYIEHNRNPYTPYNN